MESVKLRGIGCSGMVWSFFQKESSLVIVHEACERSVKRGGENLNRGTSHVFLAVAKTEKMGHTTSNIREEEDNIKVVPFEECSEGWLG